MVIELDMIASNEIIIKTPYYIGMGNNSNKNYNQALVPKFWGRLQIINMLIKVGHGLYWYSQWLQFYSLVLIKMIGPLFISKPMWPELIVILNANY